MYAHLIINFNQSSFTNYQFYFQSRILKIQIYKYPFLIEFNVISFKDLIYQFLIINFKIIMNRIFILSILFPLLISPNIPLINFILLIIPMIIN